MQFRYIATQSTGELVESNIEAKDTTEVLRFLASKGLKPVSVKPAEQNVKVGGFLGAQINLTDQIFLSKYLALMLKLGTGLLQAVNILIDDMEKPAMKSFLYEVKESLEKGQQFYISFSRYPKIFGSVYINLVKAGEASGNLDMVFENLMISITKQKELKEEIRGALIYPILLLVMSFLILFFLVTFALPKISKVFTESGFDPPLFSKVVFSVGNFFGEWGIHILVVEVIALVAFVLSYKNSLVFKKLLASIVAEIPIVRTIIKKISLQRFSQTMSLLIKAGIPLNEALDITAGVVGNPDLKESLIRVSKEGLLKGLTVGEAFRREPFFPKMVVSLIAISEKSGSMEKILSTLSDFYVKEIDSSLKILVSFLEPILLLFIGGIIGLIALAIIIPIYQLTTQF